MTGHSRRFSSGFTMIEVLASLLVFSLGIIAVIGMLAYGIIQSGRAQAASTAMATAMSVMVDPLPLGGLDWSHVKATIGGAAVTSTGYLNGYYVVRREVPLSEQASGVGMSAIHVDVYETANGTLLQSVSGQFLKRQP